MAILSCNAPISLDDYVDVDSERLIEVTILPVSADCKWKIVNGVIHHKPGYQGPFRPSWDD